MIPTLLGKWRGKYEPQVMFHTLGFKTKSAAKQFLHAKGAMPVAGKYMTDGWYRYADGRYAELFENIWDSEYPWAIHEVQRDNELVSSDSEEQNDSETA